MVTASSFIGVFVIAFAFSVQGLNVIEKCLKKGKDLRKPDDTKKQETETTSDSVMDCIRQCKESNGCKGVVLPQANEKLCYLEYGDNLKLVDDDKYESVLMDCPAMAELQCYGQNDKCCTKDSQCELNDGDCDGDNECAGDLACNTDSCYWNYDSKGVKVSHDDCCEDWKLIEEDKECKGGHGLSSKKMELKNPSVAMCAEACRGVATMFIFGRSGTKKANRCYCEMEADDMGSCDPKMDNEGYNLYSFKARCNGQDDGCCTEDKPCDLGQGDCDNHNQCMDGLTCGKDNCHGTNFDAKDDCCEGTPLAG